MRFKGNVSLSIQEPMARALPLIDEAHADAAAGRDAFVTSANDGVHMRQSKHEQGLALDLRTRDLTDSQVNLLAEKLRLRLNGHSMRNVPFNVVIEGPTKEKPTRQPHIHVEYDPR